MLFSDIEGSTSLLKGLGAAWGEALSAQRRIMRAAFAAHGGAELGTEGDSFFVVFPSAQQALAAAVQAQRQLGQHDWPAGGEIRVRIGLHTGEPERHEDGYIGLDVHRAARIAATASGGQIVLSTTTHALVGHQDGIEVRDLGWHRLKDLPEPEHLFDVAAPGLRTEHPPLRSLGTRANLPAYATALIGRESELAELCRAMGPGGARLVTLTGPGGTGKTRLAVAVADELQHQLACDLYFVPLHTADRSALMWSGIADALGAPVDAERLPNERALEFLTERAAFLILDNLEQIEDADTVVSHLLDQASGVRILATSRRPLHLVDEFQYPVSTLAVPQRQESDQLSDLQTGAVDLFVRRAGMVKPGFALTEANVDDVIALCRRMDGLPLAIELAAARSRFLSPKALLGRLDDRLSDTLSVTHRTERQKTLKALISWSYDLLDEADQQVFRRLGIFSSRFDLAAVEAVAGGGDRDPLDVVAHLIDVSLLEVVDGPDGEPMVWQLETIRRFARKRLQEAGEYDEVRLDHARWCLAAAQEIAKQLRGSMRMSALDHMKAMEEDVRAALDWCLSPTAPPQEERQETGFALLEPMDTYWYRFGYVAEGRGWHDRALQLLSRDQVPDTIRIVDALHGQGVLAVQQLDLTTGTDALERALAMAHRLGDKFREARESNSLGVARREAGRSQEARVLIERSLSLAREIGDASREATALSNVVHMHMDNAEYDLAVAAARRAIQADLALDDPWGVAINQCNLVFALLRAEGPEVAHQELTQIAAGAVALGDLELSIDLVDSGAAIWAAFGEPVRTARLLGAADHQRQLAGLPRPTPDQRHLDHFVVPARDSLAPDAWRDAYSSGKSLTIEDAVAESMATPDRTPVPRHS